MKKTPACIRLIKIYFKTLKQIVLFLPQKIKKLKPVFYFLLKVAMWLVLLVVILEFTNYSEEKIPFSVIIGGYIFMLLNYYGISQNYKGWQEEAKYDKFYELFCKQWHPNILRHLILFVLGVAFLDVFGFLSLLIFSYCMELWDRRFITNDIKQDLIIEKFNKN